MKSASLSSVENTSFPHEMLGDVFDAMTAAKIADRKSIAALRARYAAVAVKRGNVLRHSDRALLSLWDAIVGMNHGDHSVGALLALHAQNAGLGLVGEVLRQTTTLMGAYTQIERYSRLMHQGMTITIELTPSNVILRYRQARSRPASATGGQAAEVLWVMGNLALMPTYLFDTRITPVVAELPCEAPATIKPVMEVFGSSVLFNADQSLLIYDRGKVEKISRSVEPRILKYLGALAERELAEQKSEADIETIVSLELQSRLIGGAPPIEEVARSLGFSVRTLQRHLAEAGSSFVDILDDVRKSRVEQLVQSQKRSLAEIAYMLGYSEQAALSRAVRRWFGVSPSMLARRFQKR